MKEARQKYCVLYDSTYMKYLAQVDPEAESKLVEVGMRSGCFMGIGFHSGVTRHFGTRVVA